MKVDMKKACLLFSYGKIKNEVMIMVKKGHPVGGQPLPEQRRKTRLN